jgi:NADH-quinone oxidoreductase subunit D
MIGKIDVPKRAQYLRVMAAELQADRLALPVAGHVVLDMGGALGGGATVFLYCIREREDVLDLFESLTGRALSVRLAPGGGVRYDIPADWAAKCRATVDKIDGASRVRGDARVATRSSSARTQGVGGLARARQEVGISGPLVRGSGVNYDIRRAEPYSSYEDFDFKVPVETDGDCFARYRVRMVEFRESIKIVRQALDGLPAGPISSRPGVKSVGQVRIPKGEAYARVEGARGEVGCYLDRRRRAKPYRMKWRGASFSNLSVLLPHHSRATRWPTWWPSWARSTPCSARSTVISS